MPVLTAIDILGVQRFIFSSNRLRDVVTGSYLVDRCTFRNGALDGMVSRANLLLSGGGNAIIEFDSIGKAREFTGRYTRLLHNEAPGLEVVVAHKTFDSGGLARALQEIQIELARKKTERLPSAPVLRLSVTTSCRETGLPATGFDPAVPIIPLSKDVLKRREKKKEANELWSEYLKSKEGFAFPMELDHLGRTVDDTSLIGVVHVDGNAVGTKIEVWLSKKSEQGMDDDSVRREYRQWSQAIDQLGKNALQVVAERIFHKVEKSSEDRKESMRIDGKPEGLGFGLKEVNGEWMLPLRPILLGGDDLTFVCDGRIALDLAETALGVFERSNIPHLGNISACAGAAVVRVHTPFARAYDLAEKLCVSAKRMLKETHDSGCALDWHIGISRPGETVTGIRERQYRTNNHQLTCRPFRLGSGKDKAETWRWLSGMLLDDWKVGLRGKVWSERRNKVKAFAELVREGPGGVQAALKAWSVVDKDLQLPQPIEEDGFFAKSRTPLLDALELLDLHLVLEPAGPDREEEAKTP